MLMKSGFIFTQSESVSQSEGVVILEASDGGDVEESENEDVFYSVTSDERALRDQSAPLIPPPATEAAAGATSVSVAPPIHR